MHDGSAQSFLMLDAGPAVLASVLDLIRRRLRRRSLNSFKTAVLTSVLDLKRRRLRRRSFNSFKTAVLTSALDSERRRLRRRSPEKHAKCCSHVRSEIKTAPVTAPQPGKESFTAPQHEKRGNWLFRKLLLESASIVRGNTIPYMDAVQAKQHCRSQFFMF